VSFVYRPTPIVTLGGKTTGSDGVLMQRLPAGTMQGYTPNFASPALNSIGRRTISGDPWIISSGTMGRFVLGDDSLTADFFAGSNLSPIIPPSDPGLPPDFFSGGGTPILPTPVFSDPGLAPNIGIPGLPAGSGGGIPFINTPGPAAPTISSAGSASQAQATVAAGTSIFTAIANFFKPQVKATPMIAAQPGVYNAYSAQPSWFQQSNILPGAPNWMILAGGVLAAVAFASAMGGGRK
jgi:hypothetical protein